MSAAVNRFRVGTFNNISRVGLTRFRPSAYQIGALDCEKEPIQDPVSDVLEKLLTSLFPCQQIMFPPPFLSHSKPS